MTLNFDSANKNMFEEVTKYSPQSRQKVKKSKGQSLIHGSKGPKKFWYSGAQHNPNPLLPTALQSSSLNIHELKKHSIE